MKRAIAYFKVLGLTAAMFTACVKQQPEQLQQAVGFGLDVQSRSSTMTEENVISLGVFGYSTGTTDFNPADPSHLPNLFYNRAASRTAGGEWNYAAPLVYWPFDLAVKNTFFAYSPHQAQCPTEANVQVSAESESGYPTVTYTMPQLVSRQVDLLYAQNVSTVQNINRDSNGGKVLYNMRHATAWIAFLIAPQQKYNSNESYTIKSFNLSINNIVTRAKLDLGTGLWTNVETTPDIVYPFSINQTPITVGTVVRIENSDNYLMLIPQRLYKSIHDPIIFFTYTFDDGMGGAQDTSESFLSLPFPETPLSAGNVVTYVVRLSTDGAWVEFQSNNTIEQWLEEEYADEIEVY